MSVTQKEFEDKIKAKYPFTTYTDLFFFLDPQNYSSSPITVLYAYFDNQIPSAFCNLSFTNRFQYSAYIWENGTVIKDQDGLFSTSNMVGSLGSNSMYSYQIQTSGSGNGPTWITMPTVHGGIDFGFEPAKEEKKKKCECGAHSTGSNMHSDWCQLKENI